MTSPGFQYNCALCGDTISDGEVFPQGEGRHREYYCRPCNKFYPVLQSRIRTKLAELDERREKMKADVRKEVLAEIRGKKDEPKAEPKGGPTANEMRAALSSGAKSETGVAGDDADILGDDLKRKK